MDIRTTDQAGKPVIAGAARDIAAARRVERAADLERRVRIAGMVGRGLPHRRMSGGEVEALAGLPSGGALRHRGVACRRRADDRGRASGRGAQAVWQACERAGGAPRDAVPIANASSSVERAISNGGPWSQRELGLGASGIPALSVRATCRSFVAALEPAAERIRHGRMRRTLVSSEIASVDLDFNEPAICTLFGDGAEACVRETALADSARRIRRIAWRTMDQGTEITCERGVWRPPQGRLTTPAEAMFAMDGAKALRGGIRLVPDVMRQLGMDDPSARAAVRWGAAYRARRAAMDATARLGFDDARTVGTVVEPGNGIAASIPLALGRGARDGMIRRGDTGLLIGAGAGLPGVGLSKTG